MKKFQLAALATAAIGGSLLPMTSVAQTRHRTLKTIGAGVAGYEIAKHSHNRFLMKHRKAAGIAGALAAHHFMKKKH